MVPEAICYSWKKYNKHVISYTLKPFHLIAKIFFLEKIQLQGD